MKRTCEIRRFDDNNLYCKTQNDRCLNEWYRVGSNVQSGAINDEGKICIASSRYIDPAGNNHILCNDHLSSIRSESGWYATPLFADVKKIYHDDKNGFCIKTTKDLTFCTHKPEDGNWHFAPQSKVDPDSIIPEREVLPLSRYDSLKLPSFGPPCKTLRENYGLVTEKDLLEKAREVPLYSNYYFYRRREADPSDDLLITHY